MSDSSGGSPAPVDPREPRRRLLVMRHAKAAEPDDTPDHERPLAPRGRRDAPEVGAWLASLAPDGWVPTVVLCSDAVRTRQTTELLVAALVAAGGPAPQVTGSGALYQAGVHQVLDEIAQVPDDVATLLVVGHEPTMSATVALLTGQRLRFPTAGVARVELAGGWSSCGADAGSLLDLRTPS